MRNHRTRAVLAAIILTMFAACGDDPVVAPPVPLPDAHVFRASPELASIVVGDTIRVRTFRIGSGGDSALVEASAWSPADPAIARVDATGLVTGLAAGSTRIRIRTGSAPDDTTSAGITIETRVAAIDVDHLDMDSLFVGRAFRMFATARDSAGASVANTAIVWQSSDTSVIGLDQGGWLRAKRVGTSAISVVAQGIRVERTVTVGYKQLGAGVEWSDVQSGKVNACALTRDGAAHCWAWTDAQWQTNPDVREVAGGHRFVSLSVGDGFACALKADSTAWCWGQNSWGQLGQGEPGPYSVDPLQVISPHRFKSIHSGAITGTCAIRANDDVPYCWGLNNHYQFGRPVKVPDPEVAPGWGGARARSVGIARYAGCLVTVEGVGYCAGGYGHGIGFGMLGDGNDDPGDEPPSAVSGGHRWATIIPAEYMSCGMTEAGVAYCWGAIGPSFLSAPVYSVPRLVPGGITAVSLTIRDRHACVLTPDGEGYCWGYNGSARLGSGATSYSDVPLPLGGTMRWRSLAAGGGSTCGVTTDFRLFCWGSRYQQ